MNVSMGIIYGEGESAFMRLQEELLRMTSPDDSIFAFKEAEHVSSSALSRRREERVLAATTLLADSPDAFKDCGNISLPGWRQGGNQQQPTMKEVRFRTRSMTQRTYAWTAETWTLRKPDIVYRQVILDCSFEDKPSTIVKLSLFAKPDQPNTFFVEAGRRITSERLIDEGNAHCPFESFSVVRNPGEHQEVSNLMTTPILCHRKSDSLALQILAASVPDTWYAADETFSIPPFISPIGHLTRSSRDREFEAKLDILMNGSRACTMRLRKTSWPALEVRLGRGSLHLPTWTSCQLPDLQLPLSVWTPYDCAIKRTKGGFIIAKAFSRRTYLGHLTALVVDIEHVKLPRFLLFLVTRILLLILTLSMYYAILLFLGGGIIGPMLVVFIVLFASGGITWWAFLLMWTIGAIVGLAVFAHIR